MNRVARIAGFSVLFVVCMVFHGYAHADDSSVGDRSLEGCPYGEVVLGCSYNDRTPWGECEEMILCEEPGEVWSELIGYAEYPVAPLSTDCTTVNGTSSNDTMYVGSYWEYVFALGRFVNTGYFGYCIRTPSGPYAIVKCDGTLRNPLEIQLDKGNDSIQTVPGPDLQRCGFLTMAIGPWSYLDAAYQGEAVSVNGCQDNDTLYGTYNNDKLIGGSGSDFLDGESGNDTVCGDFYASGYCDPALDCATQDSGYGNDTIYGGWGSDRLYGLEGNDKLCGGGGAVELNLEGGLGADTVVDQVCTNDTLPDYQGVPCDMSAYGNDGDDNLCLVNGGGTLNGIYCLYGNDQTDHCQCDVGNCTPYCEYTYADCTAGGTFTCNCNI